MNDYIEESIARYKPYRPNWLEKFAIKVLKSSDRLPKHYAFILDGNRRYARSKNQPVIEGHKQGAETVTKVRLPDLI